MSKASKPIDIPKNLLEAEKDIDRLIIPRFFPTKCVNF